ncbi:MAG: hypothetical protein FE78DRAFT_37297 [Acidomyces sp. 'richmondensis']|nr:MAG: hypothetical protein FE78DRAFT_37297 [Acidomyces sp. 'richmondensis']
MNPGFAVTHLISHVPSIADEGLLFCQNMAKHPDKGEVFRLEEDATKLTVGTHIIGRNLSSEKSAYGYNNYLQICIIGKVAMDIRPEARRDEKGNPLVRAFRDQVLRLPAELFRDRLARVRPCDIFILGVLNGPRYNMLKEKMGWEKLCESIRSSRTFAISQIRALIFAGHDTTSSTICYVRYMLQTHLNFLPRIRKEHDDIFGDLAGTPDVIKRDGHILNKLVYTTAVIREMLRLWPPASSVRQGVWKVMIRDPETNETYPTESCMVWIVSYGLHRSPKVWGDTAEKFNPQRFIRYKEKIPGAGCWPFELGPRNRLGRELAMIESSVILALVVRSFDSSSAYYRLDEHQNDASHHAAEPKWRRGRQDLDGEEACQVLLGPAKPREVNGGPMR